MASSFSSSKLLVVEDADRVSRLPRDIQLKILSFLTIVDAARIGLTSSMWRTIFCSLSKLAFDYYQFPEIENNLNSFVNFIDQTFSHYDQSNIQVVELLLLRLAGYGIPIKKEWITFAAQHNVEKLILYGTIEKLPDCLFLCKSLVKLELALRNLLLTFPGTFSLPNLQKLKLKLLVLSESALGQDVFSTFPALEKLSIIFCSIQQYKVFSISSSKLTDFTMCSCTGMESCSFRLQAPSLSKFIYISNTVEATDLEIPPDGFQLVINGGDASMRSDSTYDLSKSVIKVTTDLFKIEVLALNHWLVEYLSLAHDLSKKMACNLFHDLVTLTMSLWPTMEHIKVLMVLLSRCPNLSMLYLEFVPSQREVLHLPSADLSLGFDIGGGLLSLNDITIENFGGDEIEMMLVKCLLATTSELNLMRIVMNIEMTRNVHLKISEILEYKTSSPYADVIFD